MTFEQYIEFVEAGVMLNPDTDRERLMLAGMGLAGETGEMMVAASKVCDRAKKVAFHGKGMDRAELIKEMGDVLWYYTLMLDTNNLTLEQVMEVNVRKLCHRYPDKYGLPSHWIDTTKLEDRPARPFGDDPAKYGEYGK